MLPTADSLISESASSEELPTKTFRLKPEQEIFSGKTDSAEAMKQAIYLILNTERYEYPIYSWNYGVQLSDLFGKPSEYVIAELERRITEALTQDDRITDVSDFDFSVSGRKVSCTFTVKTKYGDISRQTEVEI